MEVTTTRSLAVKQLALQPTTSHLPSDHGEHMCVTVAVIHRRASLANAYPKS